MIARLFGHELPSTVLPSQYLINETVSNGPPSLLLRILLLRGLEFFKGTMLEDIGVGIGCQRSKN